MFVIDRLRPQAPALHPVAAPLSQLCRLEVEAEIAPPSSAGLSPVEDWPFRIPGAWLRQAHPALDEDVSPPTGHRFSGHSPSTQPRHKAYSPMHHDQEDDHGQQRSKHLKRGPGDRPPLAPILSRPAQRPILSPIRIPNMAAVAASPATVSDDTLRPSKRVSWSPTAFVGETYSPEEYDRTQATTTFHVLTPCLMEAIADEMRLFHLTMEVHPRSRQNTRYVRQRDLDGRRSRTGDPLI